MYCMLENAQFLKRQAYTKLSATADINSLIVITDFQKKVGEPVFIILISTMYMILS